ncbi:hypothetical protein RhiJN_11310 [Ceratobasidium sp. AG-Ba]|nr:hypothetical protein RhiJN_11310 [Ceratobasidium sp. AG-Ba]
MSHRIFDFPEILSLVCKASYGCDRISLSQVSHSFFQAGAPIIWESVVGPEHVLGLLPRISVSTKHADETTNNKTILVNINGPIPHSSERFDYYAPFVKRLEVYPSNVKGYRVSGWRGLVNYAQHRTLLPNLARLTLSAFPISDHEQFLWIKVFLSPSLHTIQVVPQLVDGVATISTLVAGSLLGHIVKNCPKLRTLSLFPSNSPSFHSTLDGHGYSIADFCDNSFYDRLSALNLSELSCTTAILSDNGIYVLGTLPLLERLTLYSSASAIAVAKPPCTPALQHFGLYSTYWDEIRQIWALDLFSTLNSLTISFVDTEDSDDEQVVDWGGALMSLIACHSPALTDLEIDFGTLELELDTMSTLSPLVQLPLATVSFKSLGAMADEIVENIESIFPNATKLAFFELVFTLSELAHFSKLQRLQHLAIGLAGDTKDIVLSSTHTFSNSLHTLEIYYDMDIGPDMSIFAQYVPIHPCHNRYA